MGLGGWEGKGGGGGDVLYEVEVGQFALVGAVGAHWRNPDAVLECDIADLEGCEEGWGVWCESGSCWRVLRRREIRDYGGGIFGRHLVGER